MITELVGKVFSMRNNAHLAHFKTGSYAEHMALNAFYDDVIEVVDKLVEVYQGNFGKIGNVSASFATPASITQALTQDCEWIAQNREEIAQGLTPVENLIDELMSVYLQTIYKLINLK